MTKRSAGILLYQRKDDDLRVLLVHPGGPFWARKDMGAWSIPKGEYDSAEDPQVAARRELVEELGEAARAIAGGALLPLGEVTQKSGKRVTAFALQADFDVATLRSNLCEREWPPRSGRRIAFPEVDRAEWFALATAAKKILPGQRPLLDALARMTSG